MGTQTMAKQVSIQNFVSELRKFSEPAFNHTDQILKFLQSTPVAPETLAPYLTWDGQHYTRNLIDKSPLYELIAICWEVGQVSSVHNHREQNCWMSVPIGRLLVENYRLISQESKEGHLLPGNGRHQRDEPGPSLRCGPIGAGASGIQSARVQPASS